MIHLVAPGLLGPFPRFTEQREFPPLPALQTLLARADREVGPDSYAGVLFELFGMPDPGPAASLPTASLCYLADSGDPDESRYLLHADPIHLRPDQDRLLAFDFHRHPLDPEEAEAFVAAFNAHFAEDGLELLAPHPTHWYLAVDEPPEVQFQPLSEILGRNIDLFLPEGPDARRWRAWLNETQMLFYGLPVNTARETQQQWPVSGLWFSGAGRRPRVLGGQVVPDAEALQCPLVAGLAACAEQRGDESLQVVHDPGRAVLEADFEAWSQTMQDLDRRLAELMGQELRLYSCDGRVWSWQPAHRWRLWRQPMRVAGLFCQD
ncbi:MAG: hypothetical protein D6720_11755 [Gammaproteobacteria bacterium]|nr:MAG: hypothetical protein D6720_11755 [Gammaproteobacteria bacterium]